MSVNEDCHVERLYLSTDRMCERRFFLVPVECLAYVQFVSCALVALSLFALAIVWAFVVVGFAIL